MRTFILSPARAMSLQVKHPKRVLLPNPVWIAGGM